MRLDKTNQLMASCSISDEHAVIKKLIINAETDITPLRGPVLNMNMLKISEQRDKETNKRMKEIDK